MTDRLEAMARTICAACEENPDSKGDCRGNDYRWQDYLPVAEAAITAHPVPSVPDDEALLRQAAETIDELMYSSSTPIAAVKAGDVMIALKERLK